MNARDRPCIDISAASNNANLFAEGAQQLLGVGRADDPDHAGEVLLDAIGRGRRRCAHSAPSPGRRSTARPGRAGCAAVMEAILLDSMFDLPRLEGVKEVVISQQVVDGIARPQVATAMWGLRAER